MSFADSFKINNGNVAGPQPASVPTGTGSFASKFKVNTEPVTPKITVPPVSPYWATTTPQGSFGPSTQLDPSGKPLLDFRMPGDIATTTDKTRVDTNFDPTVAAPRAQGDLATPRVVSDAEKASIKATAGAPKNSVIDHAMALTLAGSNMKENLRPEDQGTNASQGTFEGALDEQVRNGKISLFEAQRLEAANKKLPTPFTMAPKDPSFWDNVKSFLGKTVQSVEHLFTPEQAQAAGISSSNGILSKFTAVPTPLVFNPKSDLSFFAKNMDDFKKGISQASDQASGLKINVPSKNVKTDWIDVLNVVPVLASKIFMADQVVSGALSLGEVISGKSSPEIKIPSLGNRQNLLDAEGAKKYYFDQVSAGVSEDKAFWNTALKTVGDMAALVPTIQGVSKGLAMGLAPEKLISPEISQQFTSPETINAVRQQFRDFIGGVEGGPKSLEQINLPEGLKSAIIDSIKNGSMKPDDFLRFTGVDVLDAKPSRLGQILGVSEGEAKNLLNKVYGGPARSSAAGALPGYKAKSEAPAFGLSTEERQPVGFGENKPAPYAGETDLSTTILEKLKGKSTVSKQFISDLTNSPELKQVERDTIRTTLESYPSDKPIPVADFASKVKAELLPLTVNSSAGGEPRYENITLPDDLRGPVANYEEHVYNSPIKTSAGNIHFSGEDSGNYFGHTRVEDLPPEGIKDSITGNMNGITDEYAKDLEKYAKEGSTRRVIEVQSDLYQKGNLESQNKVPFAEADVKKELETLRKLAKEQGSSATEKSLLAEAKRNVKEYGKPYAKRQAELAKLQQYTDPTAHFRMVREEIKQAAIDGKTKLQFPTGETAMKIEGLGTQDRNWMIENLNREGRSAAEWNRAMDLTPDKLKIGLEVSDSSRTNYIITDVLGDGKFKAVPAKSYYEYQDLSKPGSVDRLNETAKALGQTNNFYTQERLDREYLSRAETFDISGKVDISNPIYKFYEKDLGRYLTNKFGAKIVTDAQGVKWYEVGIKPEMGKAPVAAFRRPIFNKDITQSKEAVKQIILDSIQKDGFTKKDLRVIFTDEIMDGNATGVFFKDPIFGDTIKLYEKKGMASILDALHETKHFLFSKLPPELQKQAFEIAKKEMGPLYKTVLEKSYKVEGKYSGEGRENALLEEYIVDKASKYDASKDFGYKKSVYGKVFEAFDKILKKISDTYNKFKDYYNSLPNKEGGFAKNPFFEERSLSDLAEIKKAKDAIDEFFPMKKGDLISNADDKIFITPDSPISRKILKHNVESRSSEGMSAEDIKYLIEKAPETILNPQLDIPNPNKLSKYPEARLLGRYDDKSRKGIMVLRDKQTGEVKEIIGVYYSKRGAFNKMLEKYQVQNSISGRSAAPQSGEESSISKSPIKETPAASRISDFQRQDSNLNTNKTLSPQNEEVKKSEELPTIIKSDYKETNKGINAQKIADIKESKENKFVNTFDKPIQELTTQRDALKEAVENSPYRQLSKFTAKGESEFAGSLPEVAPGATTKFGKHGDVMLTELGLPDDVEVVRAGYEQYKLDKKRLEDMNGRLSDLREKRANSVKEDKEAKSLNYLLNKNARETETKIALRDAKEARIKDLKKSEAETQERIKKEMVAEEDYRQKVERNKNEVAKSKTIFGKIYGALHPSEVLDKETKPIVKNWFQKTIDAKKAGLDTFDKAVKEGPQNFQEILDFQAGSQTTYIRNVFDEMGTDFKRRGLDFEWKDNYMPDVWKDSPKRQAEARTAYMKSKGMSDKEIADYLAGKPLEENKALRLKLRPNFVKARFWPDYKTGMEHGLHPKYTTPADLIAYYKEAGERAIANKELLSQLKSEAKLLPHDDAPDTWRPVTLRFSREGLYAPPALADLINGKFRDENNLNIYQTFVKGTSATNRFLQDMVLSGGLPGTNINFFTATQAYKLAVTTLGDVTLGKFKELSTDLKTSFAFIRSNSNYLSRKWFESKAGYITMMSRQGIDITDRVGGKGYQTLYNALADAMSTEKGAKGLSQSAFGVGKVLFKKGITEKTFMSLMPQIKVSLFEGAYKAGISKGMSADIAEKFAADTVRSTEGIIPETGRGATTKDTLSTLVFAPPYREGLIKIFGNAGKSWTTEFKNPAYGRSRSFVAGLVVTYAIYNLINQKLNGYPMWDNPPGRELAIRFEMKNGDIAYFDIGPGLLTMPRNIALGTFALAKGDFSTSIQKYSSFLSMGFQVIFQLIANKDYFGNPIWAKTDDGKTATKKIAAYVGLETSHPYVSQIYKYVSGKQPFYWSLINMLELPVKMTNLTKEQSGAFYDKLAQQAKETAMAKAKLMPFYQKLQDMKNAGQADEANKLYNAQSDKDKAVYDSIKRSEKLKDTKAREIKMQTVYDNLQQMKAEGRDDEANAVYFGLSSEDQHAYDLIRNRNK